MVIYLKKPIQNRNIPHFSSHPIFACHEKNISSSRLKMVGQRTKQLFPSLISMPASVQKITRTILNFRGLEAHAPVN
jgi:hypothetical protein